MICDIISQIINTCVAIPTHSEILNGRMAQKMCRFRFWKKYSNT